MAIRKEPLIYLLVDDFERRADKKRRHVLSARCRQCCRSDKKEDMFYLQDVDSVAVQIK